MATPAQLTANRLNAEASTGPLTESGKQTASRNARTAGLYAAPSHAILPDERDIWDAFFQSFEDHLSPEGPLEETLAAEITHAAWRLRRCNLIECSPENAEGQLPQAIDRARTSAQRSFHRNTAELRKLQAERQFRREYFPTEHDGSQLGLAEVRQIVPVLQNLASFDPVKRETTVFNSLKNNTHRANWVRSVKSQDAARSDSAAGLQTPRSAPCPCGSGQKYKRCCGINSPAVLSRHMATAA